MKKITYCLLCSLISALALISCNKSNDLIGSWQSIKPTELSKYLPSSASSQAITNVTFSNDGNVLISSVINVTQPVIENPGVEAGYEVSVAATSSIEGAWSYVNGDDDDIEIIFDRNSFNVDVDPTGVTFRQNIVTDAQDPVTDSLTVATVNLWKHHLSEIMLKEYNRYSRLDDVKVENKTKLKLEIENPEEDVYFRKVQ